MFWDDKYVKSFAISSTTSGKGYVIDENDDLWQLDIQNINVTTAQVTGYQQVNPGTHYKQVASSYQGTTAAITTTNQLELVYIEGATYYTTDLETLPDDFNIAEVGFGYYNIFVRSRDGRILVGGGGGTQEGNYADGPFKAGSDSYNESTWAEYALPRPCPDSD